MGANAKRKRMGLGLVLLVCGVVIAIAGSVVPGVIVVVASLVMLGLAATGRSTVNEVFRRP